MSPSGPTGLFSLQVGLHAPSFSGSGVYLNPIGVVNAASYQPITASLAPGELITLFGTGLSSATMSMEGGQAFPAEFGRRIRVDRQPALSDLLCESDAVVGDRAVRGRLQQTGLANIQVTNNGCNRMWCRCT